MNTSLHRFNLRVYGILINERDEVLVSDECRNGYSFTKFPGGGLEFGEGLHDCVKREFHEEIGIAVEIGELFYLTDFFQQSAFNKNDQLISVYYRVHVRDWTTINCVPKPQEGDYEVVRWVKCAHLSENDFTFPIDQLVGRKLREMLVNTS